MNRSDLSTLEKWLYGLFAASISASANAAASIAASFITGKPFDWAQVGLGAGAAGFIAAMFYLKQSPLPGYSGPVQMVPIPPNALKETEQDK